jgi:hypothetical protein
MGGYSQASMMYTSWPELCTGRPEPHLCPLCQRSTPSRSLILSGVVCGVSPKRSTQDQRLPDRAKPDRAKFQQAQLAGRPPDQLH